MLHKGENYHEYNAMVFCLGQPENNTWNLLFENNIVSRSDKQVYQVKGEKF